MQRHEMDSVRRNRQIAKEAAKRHGISATIFLRQMSQEAGFTDATSSKGAQGPAQFMPATARGLGIKNVHDPHEAYDGAAKLMAHYLKQYGGSWAKALTAYNAGPGRVGGKLPAETTNYIATILHGKGDHVEQPADAAAGATPGHVKAGKAPSLTPGTTKTDDAEALTDALLSHPKPGQLLKQYQYLVSTGNYTTTTPSKLDKGKAPKYVKGKSGIAPTGDDLAAKLTERANKINSKKMPYLWGGGHAGKVKLSNLAPLDCSGAVSAVLGINPKVSGQFTTWGKAGDGGSKGVTIYANGHHVLMKINGHFFGTSRTNPGGGAGWIKQKDISPEYLKGFTARHA